MPSRTRRSIAVVTGTRAEYGILRTTLRAIDAHPRLRLRLIATGMHLLRRFGYTVRQIRRDGWTVDAAVRMQGEQDDPDHQAIGLGRGISGLARAFAKLDPHIVVVLGDRIEAFAAASAAAISRRLVAHIHGGDVATGDVDDSLRHAVTKLAHIHFPASQRAAERIRRLGEDPYRIHMVGAPGLDEVREILESEGDTFDPLKYAARAEYALVAQHPCTRNAVRERRITTAILRAVRGWGLSAVVLYPNSDPGHTGILQAIQGAEHRSDVRAYASLPREVYLRLLHHAKVLVGNSSSGIIESAFLGTPSVNIGPRQEGRERASRCVLDAGESTADIDRALRRALRLRPRAGSWTVYGDGRAGPRIAEVLAGIGLDRRLSYKRISL
ncbi:MAG: UDP-N-acetylglucosamine 2-epimerase (hydrolyzing) [Phycisphaerales bacterium]|nr:MAG: UDP-N-acetylglucosamine 2-epimerase (hydrolyzing) [Phycisphaerales bacterium]